MTGGRAVPKAPVTAMIFTLNEEVNLPACLDSLGWCDEVVVIDSFSNDRTERIARDAGTVFAQHEFLGFGSQRNWALANVPLRNEWILILDADERVPADLADEIARAVRSVPENVGAYRVRRRLHMWGRWLRWSSLYPTWVVRLVRRGRARYVDRGHAETQEVEGAVLALRHDLIDENLNGIAAWTERQKRYAIREAEYESGVPQAPFRAAGLWSADPLVRRARWKHLASCLPLRPWLYFLYVFFWRLGFLDGGKGFRFCRMKADFYRMVDIEKRRLRGGGRAR